MKKLIIALGAATVLAGPAFAADLPETTFAPSPIAQAPNMFDWSGFYAGLNAGYAFGDLNVTPLPQADLDGWIGGIQAGYNYQWDSIVFGIEGDVQFGGMDSSTTYATRPPLTVSSDLEWLSTIRGRVGVAFDSLMPYVTGGVAFGYNDVEISAGGVSISDDNWHTGWTVGGGIEFAISENLTMKGEYLWVDLGDENYFPNLGGIEGDADLSIVRFGLNYMF